MYGALYIMKLINYTHAKNLYTIKHACATYFKNL